jgi:hypothetical protein
MTTGAMGSVEPGIRAHLMDLHASAATYLDKAASDFAPSLGQLLQLDVDVRQWADRLADRPEAQLLSNARRELGFATYSAASGLYLQAFANLRLFLELSFAAVYFSVHELERRRWMEDRADFRWSKALDPTDGVLAPAFVREFSPMAEAECQRFASLAAAKYRHCSQFIHGKVVATDGLPPTLLYSPLVLADWVDTAVACAQAVLYMLYCRYRESLLPGDDGTLAETLEHSFSHLRSIRQALGLPLDGA